MKHLVVLGVLVAAVALSLAACGGDDDAVSAEPPKPAPAEPAPEPDPALAASEPAPAAPPPSQEEPGSEAQTEPPQEPASAEPAASDAVTPDDVITVTWDGTICGLSSPETVSGGDHAVRVVNVSNDSELTVFPSRVHDGFTLEDVMNAYPGAPEAEQEFDFNAIPELLDFEAYADPASAAAVDLEGREEIQVTRALKPGLHFVTCVPWNPGDDPFGAGPLIFYVPEDGFTVEE